MNDETVYMMMNNDHVEISGWIVNHDNYEGMYHVSHNHLVNECIKKHNTKYYGNGKIG